jgi:putative transcriptional regulator
MNARQSDHSAVCAAALHVSRQVTRLAVVGVLAFPAVLGWPAAAGAAESMTALIAVARADLPDDNFRDAVVLVMNNLGPAPAGLIVNRPTRIPVGHLFPDVERLAKLDDKLYFGGPVDIGAVSFLFRAATPPTGAVHVLDDIYLGTDRELLLRLLERDKPMDGLRILIGYAGWGPGQLEAEIARGDWTLVPARADTIFGAAPAHPWPAAPAPESGRRI